MSKSQSIVWGLANKAHSLVFTAAPHRRRAKPNPISLMADLNRVAGSLDVGSVDASKKRASHRKLERLTKEWGPIDVLITKNPRRSTPRGPTLHHELGCLES